MSDNLDKEVLDSEELVTDIAEQVTSEESTADAVDMSNAKWYVLHTYSGYENMVKDYLEIVFEKNKKDHLLYDIEIPMEEVIEEKNGKRKTVLRKKYPCYVYIHMTYDTSMWHMITQTRGVTGFAGAAGRPQPLTAQEVKDTKLGPRNIDTDLRVGQEVKVSDGALEGFVGNIIALNLQESTCKVAVNMFGKDTTADLRLDQIEKV